MRNLGIVSLAVLAACESAATPSPKPVPAPPPRTPDAVAVLPIDDDHLFRAERAEVRSQLRARLAALAPELAFAPLAEVDAALRPVSRVTGGRCADEEVSAESVMRASGGLYTSVMNVMAAEGPTRLRVAIERGNDPVAEFSSTRTGLATTVASYRARLAALARDPKATPFGLLGLAALGTTPRTESITVCEGFEQCSDWASAEPALAACFAGRDHADETALIDTSVGPARCELAGLDDLGGRRAADEACICRALVAASASAPASRERHEVDVSYLAPDLLGRDEPDVRVVETSANLGWSLQKDERIYGLSMSLARCAPGRGATLTAELDVSELGRVVGARVVGGTPGAARSCIEHALASAELACTGDGKRGRVTVSLAWPRPQHARR